MTTFITFLAFGDRCSVHMLSRSNTYSSFSHVHSKKLNARRIPTVYFKIWKAPKPSGRTGRHGAAEGPPRGPRSQWICAELSNIHEDVNTFACLSERRISPLPVQFVRPTDRLLVCSDATTLGAEFHSRPPRSPATSCGRNRSRRKGGTLKADQCAFLSCLGAAGCAVLLIDTDQYSILMVRANITDTFRFLKRVEENIVLFTFFILLFIYSFSNWIAHVL